MALDEAAIASGFEGVIGKRKDSRYESGKRSHGVAQGEADAERRVRDRRLHAGQGLARVARRDPRRLLGQAASCATPRTSARASTIARSRRCKARLEALQRKTCPFAEKPELNGADDLGRAQVVAEVTSRAGPRTARCARRCSCACATTSTPKTVRRAAATARGRDRADAATASDPIDDVVAQLDNRKARVHARGRRAPDQAHAPRSRLLARGSGAAAAGADQARPAALLRAGVAVHPAAPRRPPAHDDPHARRHRRPALLPEALGAGAARVRRDDHRVLGHKDEQHEYLLCNNLPTLLWLAQSGTLEFHVWHSRAKPGPDAVSKSTDYATSLESLEGSVLNYPGLRRVRHRPVHLLGQGRQATSPSSTRSRSRRARRSRSGCASCCRACRSSAIVKTSGKTGLHVFVPINRTHRLRRRARTCPSWSAGT